MHIRYIILSIFVVFYAFAQEINRYCAVPPFLQEGAFSNLFLALDYSGSMADYTYHSGIKDKFEKEYNPEKTYYGFFIPDKYYKEEFIYRDGKEIYRYTAIEKKVESGIKGSYLNFKYMTRIDILRWILTGGLKDGDYVVLPKMPRIWDDDAHLIRPEIQIYYRDSSTYHQDTDNIKGILQEIEKYKKKPRLGLVIFGGGKAEGTDEEKESPIIKSWIYPTFSYKKIIDEINNTQPSGGTPTGEALDDIKSYFSLKNLKWIDKESKTTTYQDPYKFDVDNDGEEEIVSCAKNFVLLITDGAWNGHKYSKSENIVCENGSTKILNPADINVPYACAIDPAEPAYYMWKGGNADLVKDLPGKQNVETFTIAAFLNTNYGQNTVKNVAIYGSFIDLDGNSIPCMYNNIPTPYPECNGSNKVCNDVFGSKCDNCGSFLPVPEESCSEWDNNRDRVPDNYKRGDNPKELKKAVLTIFENILKNLASSASVSAFYSKTKESVVAIQSIFYPEKKFSEKNLTWLGYLYSYWFYNSKDVQNLREDTNENKILDTTEDDIIEFYISKKGLLKINKYLPDESGRKGSYIETYDSLDEVKYLWEAGEKLAETYPEERNLFTGIDGENVSIDEISQIEKFLGSPDSFPRCLGNTEKEKIKNLVSYIRGKDFPGCRNRTLPNKDVWKLSDIIYSSPKIVNYPEKGYAVVYVGSNGGILHAFKVGYLLIENLGRKQLAKLCSSRDDCLPYELGEELWGFIPKNVLPYLRYLPDPDYCHMYFVDLTPYVFNYKDRKILIGGMRLGGACGCDTSNCVKPPTDTCPKDGECVGLSSYFALDITDPENPKFMWEFTDKDLGFSFSGPGIIKKKNRTYVLFASGPTDYQGNSDQDLKLFIVDLDTGKLLRKISAFKSGGLMFIPESGISNAFGGRLFTQGLDINKDNITDYIALGYSRKNLYYWKGGILFGDVRSENPDNWIFSQYFDGIKPVIAKVEFMTCFSKWYMFFGTGKWFYKTDDSNTNENNYLYGIQINCSNSGCSPQTGLTESSQDLCNGNTLKRSWKVKLEIPDPAEGYYPERMITDPSPTRDNVIAFVTMEPTKDICGFGGRTRVWALNCATGGALSEDCSSYPIKKIDGKILIQLSGGDVREVALKQYMKKDGYKKHTQWMKGVPPYKRGEYIRTESTTKIGEFLLWLER